MPKLKILCQQIGDACTFLGQATARVRVAIGTAEFLGEFVRYQLVAHAQRVIADLPHARFAETLAPGMRSRFAVPADEILVLAER